MKKTEFTARAKGAIHAGDVWNNPGGGTSTIREIDNAEIVYTRGKSRFALGLDDLRKVADTFADRTVTTADMRRLIPESFDGGHDSNCTFALLALERMGMLENGVEGKGRAGAPFSGRIRAHGETPAASKPAASAEARSTQSEAILGVLTSVTGALLEKREWRPQGAPRAVVQIVHGMAEHIARYDAFAKRLNEAGFLVVGHTYLGHGEQAETLGWFAERNGWDALEEDVNALRRETRQAYPTIPYFLLGHSMGSFIVRTYCQKYEAGLTGVILSGTGHFDPPILNVGLLLANLQCLFGRAKKPSKLLGGISFAGYNKAWLPARTAFDWLSKDTEIVDRYVADPYCGFPFTSAGYRDMFRGLKRLYPECLAAMDKDVPVRLFSGACDPVGTRGAGVKTTMRELLDAGVKDVSMKLYENGRHEMLNEVDRETVWNDLIAWMEEYL
jgi:alpha-beta hydrolase superfamily lysophospholipase